jgi:hypothetical protein
MAMARLLLSVISAHALRAPLDVGTRVTRRATLAAGLTSVCLPSPAFAAFPESSAASDSAATRAKRYLAAPADNLELLRSALRSIDELFAGWAERTTNCKFGEVRRELLETQNKEALLKAAETMALFDKEKTMVTLCKRDPSPIQDVMNGGAVRAVSDAARRELARVTALDEGAGDIDADAFIGALERWEVLRGASLSLARAALVGDYEVTTEYVRGAPVEPSSLLEQARRNAAGARTALLQMIAALEPKPIAADPPAPTQAPPSAAP